MNWGEKLWKLIFFRNKPPRQIHEIKNYSIWISIRGKIKERNKEIKFDCEERENE